MSAVPGDRLAEIRAALERGDQLTPEDRDDLTAILTELDYCRRTLRAQAEQIMLTASSPPSLIGS